MAVVFPVNPQHGDTYAGFIYDATVPSWRAMPDVALGMPAGSIIAWGSDVAPVNWLICNGSAVSRTTYASLFATIGTTYGTGDGATTFNLPDLRGKVPVGKDSTQAEFDVLGETGGAKTHTLSIAEMPSHSHTQNSHTHTGTTSTNGDHTHQIHEEYGATGNSGYYPGNGYYAQIANWNAGTQYLTSWPINSAGNHNHTFTTDAATATNQNTGGGGAHNNLQPYQVVNYIIKASAGVSAGDSELATRVNNLEYKSQNYLLNGAFDIWQRGDSVDQGSKPGADQWYFYYYYAMSQIRITSGVPANSTSAMRVRSNSNGNLVVGVTQVLETKTAARLWGKQVTFSVKVRRATTMTRPITLLVYKHATVDQSPSAGTWTNISSTEVPATSIPTGTTSADWYTASITVTIPNDGTANTLWFEVRASGGMDNGVYYEIAEAQVEEGPRATSFRRNAPSIQAELAACQRYYWRFTQVDNYQFWTLCSNWGSEIMGAIKLPVTMRVTPSISFSDIGSVYWLGNSTNYSGATAFSGRPSKEIWAFACGPNGMPGNIPVMMRPYVNTYAEATAEL